MQQVEHRGRQLRIPRLQSVDGQVGHGFVLAPQRHIRLVLTDSHGAALSPDGRAGFSIEAGDEIQIAQSPYTTRLVRIKGKNVFEIIRDKLNYDYT